MRFYRYTRVLMLGAFVMGAFSIFQLHCAIAYGQVFSGPYSNIRWITCAEEPYWFVSALVVYSLIILMVSGYVFSALRWGDD